MLVEWWQRGRPVRPDGGRPPWPGPVVGTGLFLAYSGVRFDTWLEPVPVPRARSGAIWSIRSAAWLGALGDLVGDETVGDGLHLPFALAAIALLVVCARRWPASYTALAGRARASSPWRPTT